MAKPNLEKIKRKVAQLKKVQLEVVLSPLDILNRFGADIVLKNMRIK